MADGIKISDMEEVTEVSADSYVPIIKNGENKKINAINLGVELYSLEEMPIGIWIDGKTIYRKVINVDSSTLDTIEPTYVETDINTNNALILKSEFLYCYSKIDYQQKELSMQYRFETNLNSGNKIVTNYKGVCVMKLNHDLQDLKPSYVILEYIKL